MKKLTCVLFAILCMFSCLALSAQTGAYPYATLDNGGFDSVNVGNSNVRFSIPIVSRSGRGLPFNYAIQYEGMVWTAVPSTYGLTWRNDPSWGFHGALNGALLGGTLFYSSAPAGSCPGGSVSMKTFKTTNYTYTDTQGTSHHLRYSTTIDCNGDETSSGDGSSLDGSGYVLINDGSQIQARNGLVITPAVSTYEDYVGQYTALSDANGNTISTSGDGVFADTLGVTALQVTGGAQPTTFTYPVSGQSDGATSESATITYGTFTVQTHFQAPGVGEYGPNSVSLPTQITLADGSAYHFTYEPTPGISGTVTGRLASVQLPSGGTIGYTYPGCYSNGGMNVDGSPCLMRRMTSTGTRSYNHYTTTASPYTVYTTDEVGNETDYSFQLSSNGNVYEVHHTAYQGSGPYMNNSSPQSLLEHDVYYNQDWGHSQTISAINQVDVADAQNGMRLSHTATFLNSAGLPTEFDEFDWHDNLIRQTSSTYNSHHHLTDVKVKDGSQNVFSHTSYGYDETAATGTGGNIPQHGTPSASPGNQTSVHQWLNGTDCNNSTDKVNCVTTTTAYYDTGAVQSVTTPSGTTTYSYDATQAFATGTAFPQASSGVALGTSAAYDGTSTALTSATGYNAGQTVTVASYDRLMRPTKVTMPDAGSSTLGYTPGESTVQRLKSTDSNGSQYAWQSTQYDGYGRVTRTATANGYGGYYITDTCYGAEGRVASVTIPYATNTPYGTNDCSQNHESYTYDALGRVTSVTNADSTQRSFAYLIYNGAFSTKTIDELGKVRIVDTDALGRQVIVCEVTFNPLPNSGNPTQCNTAIGATGYKTTFSYNMANRQTFVGQGVQGRNSVVDAIGRTVYTYEPERGETSYSYAYQSNGGLQVTRTRAAANHTECTVRASDGFCAPNYKTNTTYTYDVMGRLTDTTYTDASTGATVQPWRRFWYDVTGPGASFTADNAKGLLTQAKIESYDTNNSISRYSYDIMGRPVHTFDCTTGWCGPGGPNDIHRAFYRWYDYDYLGNKVHEIWNFGAYDQDSRTVGLTSTWSVAGELLSLGGGLGNVQYWAGTRGAQGNLDEQYGNGVQATFAYDAMNRQTGRWACMYTTHAGCAAGQHLEGSLAFFTGDKVTRLINEQGDNSLGYDDLGRLSSRALTSGGSGPTLSWTYDRFGNRLSQSAGGTGGGSYPQPSFNISPSNNKVTSFTYDLAGNVLNDGVHTYTYDQEGNLVYVDNGTTTWDNYDALNRRIMHVTGNNTNYLRYEYGIDGKLAGVWQNEELYEKLNRYYGPKGDSFAYWTGGTNLSNEVVHYQHTDYLGTVKIRTDGNHNIEGSYSDLPFGERTAASGTDDNTEHYATLDRDSESDTHHAQFRTYEPRIGRWLQPDPYDGSYNPRNPQSWNRYSYVMNNPLGFVDPSGLDTLCSAVWQDVYDGDGGVITYHVGDVCEEQGGGDGPGGGGGVDAGAGTPDPQTPATPTPDPKPANCHTGIGFGVQAGADTALGLGKGTAATASAGAGAFKGSNGVTYGLYASGGAMQSVSNTPQGHPAQTEGKPAAVGGGIGVGGGVFITNASNASQLRGPFFTIGGSVGVFAAFDVQISLGKDKSGNSIWQVSVTVGPGWGANAYKTTTTTAAASSQDDGC